MQNAPKEHSAILSAFMKLPFIFKIFVLSIFEWPFKIGFAVSFYANMRELNRCTCHCVLFENGLTVCKNDSFFSI